MMIAETVKITFKGWDCQVEVNEYVNGGKCLDLFDVETGEPIAGLTTWVPGLQANEVAIDFNNNGPEAAQVLIDAGIIWPEVQRLVPSGYCVYPVYKVKHEAFI